ncbi:MAG: S1 RNA-binding domain-containing protein [Verrucomicrobiota bacterium]
MSTKADGKVTIYASKQEGLDRAKAMIDRMFQEIEVGKVYTGKVVSITQFGAFMEVLSGKDGLVHVSELAEGRTENVEDIVKKATSSPPSALESTKRPRENVPPRLAPRSKGR